MYKNSVFERISLLAVVILLFVAVLQPWLTDDMFNPDLLVIARYISTALAPDFWSALLDNTLYIFIFATFFDKINPVVLVNILQNVSVFVLGSVLVKYLRPSLALAIITLTYFTIFLNQFRLAMALAICIIAMQISPYSFAKRSILLFLAFLVHLFVGAWFLVFCFAENVFLHRQKTNAKITLVIICLGIIALFNITLDPDSRYFLYFISSNSSSQSFLLAIAMLIILWPGYDNVHKGILFSMVAVSIATYSISSVSGRIAELACISIIISASTKLQNIGHTEVWGPVLVGKKRASFILLIGISFFVYRFIRLVLLGMFEIPDELLYY